MSAVHTAPEDRTATNDEDIGRSKHPTPSLHDVPLGAELIGILCGAGGDRDRVQVAPSRWMRVYTRLLDFLVSLFVGDRRTRAPSLG